MRIAIVGVGGVGGFCGSRLVESGAEVCFIARSHQLPLLQNKGIHVKSILGTSHITDIEVYDEASQVPKVDIALSCVKLYAADQAANTCKQILKRDGLAVSLQNGIDGPVFLQNILGAKRSLACSIGFSAFSEASGVIQHIGRHKFLFLERREGLANELFDICVRAGFESRQFNDPELLLWKKFVRLVPMSGVAVLCRSPIGFIKQNLHLFSILKSLIIETVTVGQSKGINLPDTATEDVLNLIKTFPPDLRPSLLRDLEAGRPLEAPWLCGRVVQLGKELGIPTPYNDSVWGALQPFCNELIS